MKKTRKMLQLEKASGQDIRELLSELNRQMTQTDVCKYMEETYGISVSQGLLSLWFSRMDIPARSFRLPDENESAVNNTLITPQEASK